MGQVHNGLERAGHLTQALKDALNAADSEGGLERFGETMTPTINLWDLPEWAFLRGERLCADTRLVAAIAAEVGVSALINPAGSQVLAIVEAAAIDIAVVMTGSIGFANEGTIVATLGPPSAGDVRDLRWIPTNSTRCGIAVGTDPAQVGSLIEQRRSSGAGVIDFQCFPFVLAPGFGLIVQGQTVNQAFNVNYKWRERPVFSGELG